MDTTLNLAKALIIKDEEVQDLHSELEYAAESLADMTKRCLAEQSEHKVCRRKLDIIMSMLDDGEADGFDLNDIKYFARDIYNGTDGVEEEEDPFEPMDHDECLKQARGIKLQSGKYYISRLCVPVEESVHGKRTSARVYVGCFDSLDDALLARLSASMIYYPDSLTKSNTYKMCCQRGLIDTDYCK